MSSVTMTLVSFVVVTLFAAPVRAQDASGLNSPMPDALAGGNSNTPSVPAPAPRRFVSRYELFAAPSYLSTPKLNMVQRGFNADFGFNVNHWLAFGADYSILRGHSAIEPAMLTPSLQRMLASALPPGVNLSVPFDSSAYTFGAGPQFSIRRLRRVTFFVRPAGGALHESFLLKPRDPISTMLVRQLVPTHRKSDLTIFYGAGGGLDLNLSQHMALRFAVDVVHMKLYDSLLAGGENGVRISIAPVFRFGRGVK